MRMTIKDNLYYWEKSLDNPESFPDKYYIIDNIIVSNEYLVKCIHELRESITSFCYILKRLTEIDSTVKNKILENILQRIYKIITETNNIQYSEFIAFWKTRDISYSVFKKIENLNERMKILKSLLKEYCERRDNLYIKLGYSDTTIQVLYDSSVSRKKGILGSQKIAEIIETIAKEKNINIIQLRENHDTIPLEQNCYFLVDQNKKFFDSLIQSYDMRYDYGERHQGKIPDIVVKINSEILIIEAKHLKESGGAQDKQVRELIEFISQSENNRNIHYVSFMDGIYFNNFINPQPNTSYARFKRDIEKALNTYKQNFFVNTAGLIQLILDIIS